VAVFSGASEIGQGTDSVVAYIAAEELGVPLDWVRVFRGDTDFTPVDLGAYSSRGTLMIGNACIQACRRVAALIRDAVAEPWEVDPSRIVLRDGTARESGPDGRVMPIREAFNLAETKHGALGATGSYNTPKEGVHGD
jgi:CO/xanthine dehydrogenase Mo-binding subunit